MAKAAINIEIRDNIMDGPTPQLFENQFVKLINGYTATFPNTAAVKININIKYISGNINSSLRDVDNLP